MSGARSILVAAMIVLIVLSIIQAPLALSKKATPTPSPVPTKLPTPKPTTTPLPRPSPTVSPGPNIIILPPLSIPYVFAPQIPTPVPVSMVTYSVYATNYGRDFPFIARIVWDDGRMQEVSGYGHVTFQCEANRTGYLYIYYDDRQLVVNKYGINGIRLKFAPGSIPSDHIDFYYNDLPSFDFFSSARNMSGLPGGNSASTAAPDVITTAVTITLLAILIRTRK